MDAIFLLNAHSGWRYIVITILVLAVLKFIIGWVGKQQWGKFDQFLGATTPIAIDIQWLLGIVLWAMQMRWNGDVPLVSWEHPLTMTLSLVIAHMGWARAKQATDDASKFQTATIGFLVAGLLIGVGVARMTGYL